MNGNKHSQYLISLSQERAMLVTEAIMLRQATLLLLRREELPRLVAATGHAVQVGDWRGRGHCPCP